MENSGKNNKLLILVLLCISVLTIGIGVLLFCTLTPTVSSVKFTGDFGEENLIALNRQSVKGRITNPLINQYLYFKFDQQSLDEIKDKTEDSLRYSVCVTFKFDGKTKQSEKPFAFGFLYESDFDGPKKLKKQIPTRPLVAANLNECNKEFFKVSMMSRELPVGFFAFGKNKYSCLKAELLPSRIGFVKSGEESRINYFGFDTMGGTISFNGTAFDVNRSQDVNIKNRSSLIEQTFPGVLNIKMKSYNPEDYSKQPIVKIDYGGNILQLFRMPEEQEFNIQLSSLYNCNGKFSVLENSDLIESAVIIPNDFSVFDPDLPIKTDLGLVLSWPKENWRSSKYELFEWNNFPGALFFDFADYETQNKFFTRAAYFVEKSGYKGTIVSNEFCLTHHGYNAHDYKAADLARFFNALRSSPECFDEEIKLRNILLKNGVIVLGDDGNFKKGKGSVISISRESQEYQRKMLMAHESWHAIYFEDEDFRNAVSACYYMFDAGSMKFLKNYFKTTPSLNYDLNDEYLMQNEFMAYILQNNLKFVSTYFVNHASSPNAQYRMPDDCKYVIETKGAAFENAGAVLDEYVHSRWGLNCGRVFNVGLSH